MKIAVLSLCRDRLSFTQACFRSLDQFAGCTYDHFVLDQASQDGTRDWLEEQFDDNHIQGLFLSTDNIGVSRGINRLLDSYVDGDYDVVVKFDNDCELLVQGTLEAACKVALAGYIASPHIMGLDSPPSVESETEVLGYRVGIPNLMGGVFMAIPAVWYSTYRHDETNPIWGMDDARIVEAWRAWGGEAGYLLDYPANHYLSTEGQRQAEPVYFARKMREFT